MIIFCTLELTGYGDTRAAARNGVDAVTPNGHHPGKRTAGRVKGHRQ